MKIETNKIKPFLKKVRLGTGDAIEEIVLDFTENGIELQTMCASNTIGVKAKFNKSNFTDYQALGKVGILDLSKLISILERFETVEMSIEGNLLILKEKNKKVEVETAEPTTIQVSDIKIPEITEHVDFKFSVETIKRFIDTISINADTNINLVVEPNKFVLKNTKGSYKFTESYDVDNKTEKKVSVTFGSFLKSALDGFSKEVVLLKIKNDYPLFIVEDNETNYIEVVVAPLCEGSQ